MINENKILTRGEFAEMRVNQPIVGEKNMEKGRTEIYDCDAELSRAIIARRRNFDNDVNEVQDNFLIMPGINMYAVFDGASMSDGARAAKLAAKAIKTKIEQFLIEKDIRIRELSIDQVKKLLQHVVRFANKELAVRNMNIESSGEKLITTMTLALVIEGKLIVVNVGDSRAYFIPNDTEIEQITVDHDAMRQDAELRKGFPKEIDEIKQGRIEASGLRQAQRNPLPFLKNKITNSLGRGANLDEIKDFPLDIFVRDVASGDKVLLCSDGITKELSDDEIDKGVRGVEIGDMISGVKDLMKNVSKNEGNSEQDDKVMAVIEVK